MRISPTTQTNYTNNKKNNTSFGLNVGTRMLEYIKSNNLDKNNGFMVELDKVRRLAGEYYIDLIPNSHSIDKNDIAIILGINGQKEIVERGFLGEGEFVHTFSVKMIEKLIDFVNTPFK